MGIRSMRSYAREKKKKLCAAMRMSHCLRPDQFSQIVPFIFPKVSFLLWQFTCKNLCAAMRGPFHLYGHMCIYIYIYVHKHIWTHLVIYGHKCAYMYISLSPYIYIHIHIGGMVRAWPRIGFFQVNSRRRKLTCGKMNEPIWLNLLSRRKIWNAHSCA